MTFYVLCIIWLHCMQKCIVWKCACCRCIRGLILIGIRPAHMQNICRIEWPKVLSSSSHWPVRRSQLIQLYGQKVSPGPVMELSCAYRSEFLPSQLDQLTPMACILSSSLGLCHFIMYVFYGPSRSTKVKDTESVNDAQISADPHGHSSRSFASFLLYNKKI